MGDDLSLLRQTVEILQEGSVHTLDLARQVLGLTGNAGAASAAVFTLLGADPRFEVDATGQWSLAGKAPRPEEELLALDYAVVDVETTGGSPGRGHRMTEVAIVEIRQGFIGEEFHTLINPGRRIPPRISAITGITDDMVMGAPFFDEVAEEVMNRLEGRVFVAHNVSFDWGFVSRQLQDTLGTCPEEPRLCTVQLTRRLIPGLRRRNLDAVASYFGVPIEGRHRALGDAMATARLLLRLLDEAGARGVLDLPALQLLLRGGRP